MLSRNLRKRPRQHLRSILRDTQHVYSKLHTIHGSEPHSGQYKNGEPQQSIEHVSKRSLDHSFIVTRVYE